MNKKSIKTIYFLLVILIGSNLLLSGCSSDDSKEKGVSSGELPNVTWKFSHTQAPDHYMNIAAENMAQQVSDKTDGKFNIEIFHSGTLGAEQEIIEGMQLGTIAGNYSAANLLGNFVPSYDIFSLPGVFRDEEHIKKVFDTPEIMDPFKEKALEEGIRVEGYYQNYFRQLYTKDPITNPDSLNSEKIRVMGSPYLVDSFNELGANPTTTAWAELYTGLQLGIDQGMDHVASSVRSMNFYDHLSYVCEPKLFASPMFLTISQPMYDKLPEEYKEILDEALNDTLDELRENGNQMNIDDLEFLTTEGGLEYIEVDPAEFQAITESVKNSYISKLEDWVQELVPIINDVR